MFTLISTNPGAIISPVQSYKVIGFCCNRFLSLKFLVISIILLSLIITSKTSLRLVSGFNIFIDLNTE